MAASRKRDRVPGTSRHALAPYKFVVTPVVHRLEGDKLTGEATLQPVVVYGIDGLTEWASAFPAALREHEDELLDQLSELSS